MAVDRRTGSAGQAGADESPIPLPKGPSLMRNMSWPVMWLIIIVVLVAGYFAGQMLGLDHKAPTSASVSAQHR